MIKINHGCGAVRPAGWINTDSSLNAHSQKIPLLGKLITSIFGTVKYDNSPVRYMDLNHKWNFKNNSVDIVYSSHLFEHLRLKSASLYLMESFRVLKPNGIIRIVVPDLYQLSKNYVEQFDNELYENPSEHYLWAINMHREGQYNESGIIKRLIAFLQDYPHQHKYMYDKKSLKLKFEKAGFIDISFSEYGISNYINCITEVESGNEKYISVYIEAKKP
jgi:predicted SAM-dependent methyltransferase